MERMQANYYSQRRGAEIPRLCNFGKGFKRVRAKRRSLRADRKTFHVRGHHETPLTPRRSRTWKYCKIKPQEKRA
ncbi:uncharacterized protein LAESUDRAFT_720892 [Laetiporus sulphureus 93-53]|uniref:Uncharacterized protein n=1 Tax=Laetiporus sulphureus 93-53 TaxID=1314785 RepID=A0A165HEL6_9APHY|nr:uncharacterized protein LAESUDRAFT_720892 [Laetiporus sulphureus 93-53]KZT11635.1 hypothetical protein LAESUDRAFT_720892 [Laetiporus sulphureus 93-53]